MSERDAVIWFSIFDWWNSSHGHSDIQLALEMARRRPVLFINSIGMRVPAPGRTERVGRRVLRKLRSVSRGLVRPDPERPKLAVLTLLSPPGTTRLETLSTSWSAAQVRLALARLNWSGLRAIVTVPTTGPIARSLCGNRFIYYRSDDHGAFEEVSPAALRFESDLLDSAPVVAYAAHHLMDQEAGRVGIRARYLQHGVDPALFNPETEPDAQMLEYPSPRLGFFGSLRKNDIDFDMLRETADALPEASVLIMGDRLDHASALRAAENIHLIPPRPHSAMPEAWAALDVALLPYRMNDWSRAIDPIKLREILAMGIPIASTALPAVASCGGPVFCAEGRESFVNAIRCAIATERCPVQGLPDWSSQAQLMETWLDTL